MTSLAGPRPTFRAARTAADTAADAALAAGVEVRLLHDIDQMTQVSDLFLTVWKPGNKQPPVAGELMRAMVHSGCYVAGALDTADGTLVGACAGFFGAPRTRTLHSHIAGVLPGHQGRHVGHALKTHQYSWAVEQGLDQVTWTFDPLVRRNAYFNLAKLGALPVEYAVDFYGDMSDGINAGQGSDRVLVSWAVGPTVGTARHDQRPAQATVLLESDPAGRPLVTGPVRTIAGATYLVQVPDDVETLRLSDPDVARAWRLAVREVLGGLVAGGARVVGFTRDGHYVVQAAR